MPSPNAIALAVVLIAADPKPLLDASFGPQVASQSAQVYKFEVPKGAKRVEVIFIGAGRDDKPENYTYHLMPGQGAEARINGKLILSHLRKDKDGSWFKNHLRDVEYAVPKTDTNGIWMDVSPVCKVGENEISFQHRSPFKFGVRVRAWKK